MFPPCLRAERLCPESLNSYCASGWYASDLVFILPVKLHFEVGSRVIGHIQRDKCAQTIRHLQDRLACVVSGVPLLRQMHIGYLPITKISFSRGYLQVENQLHEVVQLKANEIIDVASADVLRAPM